jgi:hypothetical protein
MVSMTGFMAAIIAADSELMSQMVKAAVEEHKQALAVQTTARA